jgi:peptide/nickel transport system permease protein
MIFGTTFGLVSGYFGGLWDEILMRIVDIFLAVPGIMMALVIILVFGQSFVTIIGILTMFSWVFFARQLRAETHQIKVLDYVSFAKVAGASTPRILIRHIFPGIVSTMTVIATLNVGNIILTESILSYLGAGIPPPTPAWGAMVSEGRSYLASSWWIAFFPGVAIFLTVLAFNFLGDWLRDFLDPRLRQVEQGKG